jgi:hypothetical protein
MNDGCKEPSKELLDSLSRLAGNDYNPNGNLKTIWLNNLKKVNDNNIFNQSSKLETVIVPNLEDIKGDWFLSECNSLKTVVLGNKLKSIGSGSFSWNDSLKILFIPNSVTSIGKGCFLNNAFLKILIIPNGLKSSGEYRSFSPVVKISIPKITPKSKLTPKIESLIESKKKPAVEKVKERILVVGDQHGNFPPLTKNALESVVGLIVLGDWKYLYEYNKKNIFGRSEVIETRSGEFHNLLGWIDNAKKIKPDITVTTVFGNAEMNNPVFQNEFIYELESRYKEGSSSNITALTNFALKPKYKFVSHAKEKVLKVVQPFCKIGQKTIVVGYTTRDKHYRDRGLKLSLKEESLFIKPDKKTDHPYHPEFYPLGRLMGNLKLGLKELQFIINPTLIIAAHESVAGLIEEGVIETVVDYIHKYFSNKQISIFFLVAHNHDEMKILNSAKKSDMNEWQCLQEIYCSELQKEPIQILPTPYKGTVFLGDIKRIIIVRTMPFGLIPYTYFLF